MTKTKYLCSASLAALTINAAIVCVASAQNSIDIATPGPSRSAAVGNRQAAEAEKSEVSEIIVTANRRDENILKVPISVTAVSAATLSNNGIHSMGDLSHQVPNLTFTENQNRSTLVSIRGISSFVGASTTGIYIDDTPIQGRFLGASQSSSNPFPILYDIDRVEVLQGPQGTLFGAGSEGGTVRFITPSPSLTAFRFGAQSEVATTQGGAPSYEIGVAGGGPLVRDRIGLQLGLYYRDDGGWIDRVEYPTLSPVAKDTNDQKSYLVRAKLKINVTDNLTITPSITYQNIHGADDSAYWGGISSPSSGKFLSAAPLAQPSNEYFTLYSLNTNYDINGINFINNISYFDRRNDEITDYSVVLGELLSQNFTVPLALGNRSPTNMNNSQRALTEEFRIQSSQGLDNKLSWVVGVFYQSQRQGAQEIVHDNNLNALTEGIFGAPAAAVFGEGPLQPGNLAYVGYDTSNDSQIAGFGQIDWRILNNVTLTAGLRVANFGYHFTNFQNGPFNGGASGSRGQESQTSATPKIGIKYQASQNYMVYASASEGVRQGGGNTQVPTALCATDLGALGLDAAPKQYASDSVWSYEAGTKGQVLNRRLQFDASIFYIDWKDIQTIVPLLGCGFNYIANAGSAISKGIELHGRYRVNDELTLDASIAYTDAYYSKTVRGAPTAPGVQAIIVDKGDQLPIAPLHLSIDADYKFFALENSGWTPYLHGNFDFSSRYVFGTGPGTVDYDPYSYRRSPISLLNVEAGAEHDPLNVVFFVNNALNSTPVLSDMHFSLASTRTTYYTLRPRTFGVRFSYRY